MSAVLAGRDLLVGDAERGVQDRAGRDAGEDALALDQLAGAADGVVRADREPGVEQRRVVELGDEALVDVAQAVDQLAVARLGGDDLDARACARAGSGATPISVPVVPRPGDEVGDRRQVGEDLRAGAVVVRLRRSPGCRTGRASPSPSCSAASSLATAHGLVRAAGGRRGDDLRAVHLQQLAPLDRGVLRHHADQPVAALPGDHRQRDAGVAAGRLEDRGARAAAARPSRPPRSSRCAARSLIEPVGLWSSSLAHSRTSGVGDSCGSPTSGVPPSESTSEAKRAMELSDAGRGQRRSRRRPPGGS